MKNNPIITVVLLIVVAAAGFYGGTKYQQSRNSQLVSQFRNGQGNFRNGQNGNQNQANRQRQFGGGVFGQVLSLDDKSVTVKLPDGSSRIVIFTPSTSVNKTDPGSISDLKAGENVAIFGSANTDGSLTAQSIQLNPQMPNRNPNNEGTAVTPTSTQ
jgi:hypothetical protein